MESRIDIRRRQHRRRSLIGLGLAITATGLVAIFLGWQPVTAEPGPPPARLAANRRLVRSRTDLVSRPIGADSSRLFLRNASSPFDVTVAPGSVLRIGYVASNNAVNRPLVEIDLDVTFHPTDGPPLTLWQQKLPRANAEQLHEAIIPLDAVAGKRGTITLGSGGHGGSRPADVSWTPPKIESTKPEEGLNIILVSIDTLRADHLGSYGAAHDTSPNLDRLARQGVRFRQAIASSSWTLPSHASMLSGLHPSHHETVAYRLRSSMSADYPLLAELMWDFGYDTAAFTEGGFIAPQLGFARGFERYDVPAPDADGLSQNLTQTLQWLQQHRQRPFFLFFHTYTVHAPYTPPPPYDTMFDPDYHGPFEKIFLPTDVKSYKQLGDLRPRALRHVQALYDGEIRYLDTRLGELFDFLNTSGLASRTCVIVTADHGEEFQEHGNLFHNRAKLYEELIRIPLIVWCPGRPGGGRVVEQPVSLVDITPTILDLVGAPLPTGLDGASLAPTLRGEGQPREGITVSEVDGSIERREGNVVALRTTEHKFVHQSWATAPQLFDLRRDPGETHDVSGEQSDIVRNFANLLESPLLARRPHTPPTADATPAAPPVADAATIEHLRALGYQP